MNKNNSCINFIFDGKFYFFEIENKETGYKITTNYRTKDYDAAKCYKDYLVTMFDFPVDINFGNN